MKTSLLNKTAGAGLGLLFLAIVSSNAVAGPSPQFWQQQEKQRAENAAKATAAAQITTTADTPAMACAACKTTAVREFHAGNAGGKVPARDEFVGSKHTCSACGGAVTTVHGKTTNDMTANCPICAKAKAANAACCTATS